MKGNNIEEILKKSKNKDAEMLEENTGFKMKRTSIFIGLGFYLYGFQVLH